MFPQVLRNSVWHTTTIARHQAIMADGAILPNPDMPEEGRWGTARGIDGHPYVRSIGGVSLFDFTSFDENSYAEKFPVSNWSEFVPCRRVHGSAIWIEIDTLALGETYVSGHELLLRWKKENSSRRFMPLIEAACMGHIPISAFHRTISYHAGQWEVLSDARKRN